VTSAAERLAVLPDLHRLTLSDADLIRELLGNVNTMHTARDGEVGFWTVHDTRIETVGELRALATRHPKPVPTQDDLERAELRTDAELLATVIQSLALTRVRLRALTDLLRESGVIQFPEWQAKYDETCDRDAWAFIQALFLKPEAFETKFADWVTGERSRPGFVEFRQRPEKPSGAGE
jgi:Arc/MetJ family transcription regulator